MKGFLYIDKPEDWTSFDVVAFVRKMVARLEDKKPKNVKVGHTGTLDPAATGLLVLCVGKEYTKQVQGLIKQDKTYEVELTLGKTSDTGDREGNIEDISDVIPSEYDVLEAVNSFVGDIEQIPPKYSAIKINGKRAYDLARKGEDFKIEPRKVKIYSINDIEYRYPLIKFSTRVSSGTYIRTLAEDIGNKLETGAYMSALRRTTIGEVNVAEAYAVSELTEENLQKILASNR